MTSDPVASLRRLSVEELARAGEASLKERLLEQAILAHARHAPLTEESLQALLSDPDCVRYPTRLVYEFADMAIHQFAQPGPDLRNPAIDGRVLYLRPALRGKSRLVALAVAYMLPVINYGEDIITDEHCLLYGAALCGMIIGEFYSEVCAMAEIAGAEARLAGG